MATATLNVVSGIVYSDQRNWYPEPEWLARVRPSSTPYLSDLLDMGFDTVKDVEYKTFEREPSWIDQYFDINNGSGEPWAVAGAPGDTNAAVVDGATGIVIDDSLIGRNVAIYDSTSTTFRGVAQVTAVASSTALTLTAIGNPRSATQAIANLSDNDRCYVIGSGFSEVSESPEAYSTNPTTVWNSLEHFRTSLEVSKDMIKAALRGVEGQNKLSELRTDKLDEHKMQVQRALLDGYRRGGIGGVAYGADPTGATTDTFAATHTNDAASNRVPMTMGLRSAILRYGISSDTHVDQTVFDRVYDEYDISFFTDDSIKWFRFDPMGMRPMRAYCGVRAYAFWSKLDRAYGLSNSNLRVSIGPQKPSSVGFHVRELETPNGMIELVRMNDWRDPRYRDHMLICNPDYVRLAHLPGEDISGSISYHTDIKTDNRPLIQKDEYHNQVGLRVTQMRAHSLVRFS